MYIYLQLLAQSFSLDKDIFRNEIASLKWMYYLGHFIKISRLFFIPFLAVLSSIILLNLVNTIVKKILLTTVFSFPWYVRDC